MVYINDVLVSDRTFEQHLGNVSMVFARSRKTKLKLSREKATSSNRKLVTLGTNGTWHKCDFHGFKKDRSSQYMASTNLSLLVLPGGLSHPLHRDSEAFAQEVAGMQALECVGETKQAFQELKDRLMSSPVLSYPRPDVSFIFDTDASNLVFGAVLSQLHDGQEQVIAKC